MHIEARVGFRKCREAQNTASIPRLLKSDAKPGDFLETGPISLLSLKFETLISAWTLN
jgi:hypothetical protein